MKLKVSAMVFYMLWFFSLFAVPVSCAKYEVMHRIRCNIGHFCIRMSKKRSNAKYIATFLHYYVHYLKFCTDLRLKLKFS